MHVSTGPIEFIGESAGHEVPDTEFGGADGLIQPAREDGLFRGDPAARGGHDDDALTASELRGMVVRRGMVPLDGVEGRDGVSATGEDVVDPHTGRAVPIDRIEDGLSVLPSDSVL
jgi:hypothetical protein